MKAYLQYFKINLIYNLQYRAAALAGISTQVFFGLIMVALYLAIYSSNNTSNAPMNLAQLVTYCWLGQAFFALSHPYYQDKDIIKMVKNGNISYELIRPQSFYWKVYIKLLSSRLVATLLRFLPIIILGFLLPKPYNMTLPKSFNHFILFVMALFLSLLLITSLSVLIHIIAIRLLDHKGIFSFYSVISELFMGLIIPLPFLPKILMIIANCLPFRYLSDFPYRMYTGNISVNYCTLLLINAFFWIIIIIVIGNILTNITLKKVVVQGG